MSSQDSDHAHGRVAVLRAVVRQLDHACGECARTLEAGAGWQTSNDRDQAAPAVAPRYPTGGPRAKVAGDGGFPHHMDAPVILFVGARRSGRSTLLGLCWDWQSGNAWDERALRPPPSALAEMAAAADPRGTARSPGSLSPQVTVHVRGRPFVLVELSPMGRSGATSCETEVPSSPPAPDSESQSTAASEEVEWTFDAGRELAALLSAVALWPRLAAIVMTADGRDSVGVRRLLALLTAWQSFFPPAVFARMAVVLTHCDGSVSARDQRALRQQLSRAVSAVFSMDDQPFSRSDSPGEWSIDSDTARSAYLNVGRTVIEPLLALATRRRALNSGSLIRLYRLAQVRQRLLAHAAAIAQSERREVAVPTKEFSSHPPSKTPTLADSVVDDRVKLRSTGFG